MDSDRSEFSEKILMSDEEIPAYMAEDRKRVIQGALKDLWVSDKEKSGN
jgi:hypothetical protein